MLYDIMLNMIMILKVFLSVTQHKSVNAKSFFCIYAFSCVS